MISSSELSSPRVRVPRLFALSLHDYVSMLAYSLENANRIGCEVDDPEGVRYVQISDTLVKEIVYNLRNLK